MAGEITPISAPSPAAVRLLRLSRLEPLTAMDSLNRKDTHFLARDDSHRSSRFWR